MLAIFSKELIHLFKSPIGFIYLAVNALISAIFFVSYNLFSASANFADFLNRSQIIFFLSIPLLTMNLFADERKNRTEQLLLTSPIAPHYIILGKFLATLVPFAINLAIYISYYIILEVLAYPDFGKSLAGFLGFICLGSSFIALGVFVSVLSQNQIITAIICFAFMFLFWLLPSFANILPQTILSGQLFFITCSIIASYYFYKQSNNHALAILIFLVLAIALALLSLFKIDFFENLINSSLNFFSLSSRFDYFAKGIIRIADLLFYASFTTFFIYLASNHLNSKKWGS